MPLSAIIGHARAVDVLRRLLRADRVPQALVIEGPPGTGRRTLAKALGAALLCAQPVDGDACGGCESCRLFAADSHPDAVVLPGDAERAEIPVDMIRERVVDPASETPLIGARRVFVLPGAERLRGPAANVLLKVLEEPPPGVHLMMTAIQAGGLLPTIQSRSQVIRLQSLQQEQLQAVLRAGGIDPEEARRRSAIGAGSHRGLWGRGVAAAPLGDLRRLVCSGYDAEAVARVMQELPATSADVPAGATVTGEQRRLLFLWFDALLAELRHDLRGRDAGAAVDRIEHVLRLRGDLGRYVQPRLIVEALGLAAV